MMQHMQPAGPPHVIHFTIAKFSQTTTSVDHVGPLNWNHVNGRGDLHCIFEKVADVGSAPSRLIQKVLRGDILLEQLDLVQLVRHMAVPAPLRPPPKSHFAVVVKLPCIAVKYLYHDTQVRRFQIKFATEQDYFMVLALLGEINCPMTESNASIPASRQPPSISSWTSGDISTCAPGASNATSNAHGMNGFHFGAGAIASGVTTPMRASSPASTVSYALPRSIPPLPAAFRPKPNMGPTVAAKPLYDPFAMQDMPHSSQDPPNSQLSTASAIHDVDQLNQMLPPKRDLPFSKPTAKRTMPADLSLGKQPHPKEALPATSRLPGPTNELTSGLGVLGSQSQDLSQQDFSQMAMFHEEPPASSQVPLVSQPSEPMAQLPSAQSAPLPHQLPDVPNAAIQPNEEQKNEPKPCAVQHVTDDKLAEYLTYPTTERIAFLENWMCELIEDDSFMTLCHDVEGTWRRFALGQKR
ncbi:unnamed protein product [Penicillium olsonii]|uniref:Uncharacterized protein n=1 Tax=Penicillium olsonii TaxID=99116 RepID=A0A9W4MV89_PENOL|nr:unnamed protein product [Penicillium olsonii]CAG8163878.1 unnamed protein product [Penicillium olsonii]